VRLLHGRTGRRMALIGHSRGGHFARAVAARMPDQVAHSISLGADLQAMFGITAPTQLAVTGARRIAGVTGHAGGARCLTADCGCAFTRDYRLEFPGDRVRLTSVYSTGDGVVRWHGCVVPYADCVQVPATHVGLIANRSSYRAIGRALAEPELEPVQQ
jgi:pimeloyl-ACP methyl ester carboxylesterase